jgi:hypothetical protein
MKLLYSIVYLFFYIYLLAEKSNAIISEHFESTHYHSQFSNTSPNYTSISHHTHHLNKQSHHNHTTRFKRRLIDKQSVQELNQILFQNQTNRIIPFQHPQYIQQQHRNLKRAYTGTVPCVICRGLSTCEILNGFQIEEVYYPKNLNYLETCNVIESLGKRIESVIFGKGRTFRDTDQCRGN